MRRRLEPNKRRYLLSLVKKGGKERHDHPGVVGKVVATSGPEGVVADGPRVWKTRETINRHFHLKRY
jgi:hypothetical protein